MQGLESSTVGLVNRSAAWIVTFTVVGPDLLRMPTHMRRVRPDLHGSARAGAGSEGASR